MKTRGKLSAENPHAGFDVAGAGNVLCFYRGAPDLDPTDEGELEIGPSGYYASSLLYGMLCKTYDSLVKVRPWEFGSSPCSLRKV